ncbi:hypothetical protein DFS34DRAFT_590698 [Phlyctochytrium arcticum]|nr:hypothetical protein DFS34DRAFT_590698 [Phlyctochytrium arcticum]
MSSTPSPRRRPGAARIPFLIIAFLIPTLLGFLISSAPTVVDAECVCHSDAPTKLSGFLSQSSASPNPTTTRVSCNADVAIYMTRPLMNKPRSTTGWIVPFYNKAWKYLKETYGSCSVPRTLGAPIGPACEAFGAPKPLIAQFGLGQSPAMDPWSDGWGAWTTRFDPSSGGSRTNFRTWLGQTHNGWLPNDYGIKRLSIHYLCMAVETGAAGVNDTPAMAVWGQSTFSDICSYDFFNKTGMTSEATQAYTEWRADSTDTYPPGTSNARWFRDWYYPLWVEKGYSLAWHETFFGLLSQYFPTQPENSNANLVYTRRMNMGEYVHFMSATVGRNLRPMAITSFNSGFSSSQFTTARTAFPALNSMYTYP